jgi:molybdopterin biosynthesis enzyme
VTVAPFQRRAIGAVAREHLDDKARERFQKVLAEKVSWFGATLLGIRFAPRDHQAVTRLVEEFRSQGAEIIILAGAGALDPLDPIFQALTMLGAKMVRHGVPAHPGSLFWMALLGETPLIGMPTCGMFSQATTFDLILPRILAGERIDEASLASLGHGGLLSREMAFRFPPYRPQQLRGELPEPG